MKTAISLPDAIFESADELAEELGVSRSRLYADAVAEYVARHQDAEVTQRLNRLYTEIDSGVDPALADLQSLSVSHGEW